MTDAEQVRTELVIGLVGAIRTDLPSVATRIGSLLTDSFDYTVSPILLCDRRDGPRHRGSEAVDQRRWHGDEVQRESRSMGVAHNRTLVPRR
jgi:hypothetical protein